MEISHVRYIFHDGIHVTEKKDEKSISEKPRPKSSKTWFQPMGILDTKTLPVHFREGGFRIPHDEGGSHQVISPEIIHPEKMFHP